MDAVGADSQATISKRREVSSARRRTRFV